MIELFANLSWPGAVAIIGSVITIVTGIVAIAATYYSANKEIKPKSALPSLESTEVHSRISTLRDKINTIETQQQVLSTKMENLIRQCEAHDERDVDDFKTINAKVDKLMEIIVEMLKDD